MVVLAPDPVIAPGSIVQFPAGKPLKITLPVLTVHVGCVITPITGAVGVAAVIVMLAAGNDVQPAEFVTVNWYVPAANPDTVVLVADPVNAPGLIVQEPAGNPLMATLPVETAQVG